MEHHRFITKAQAAKILGISAPAMQKDESKYPPPGYYVKNEKGKTRIDTHHPEWNLRVNGDVEPCSTDEEQQIKYRSLVASTRIKEERAKQEEIKTAEIKKELAPISLVKYYFSFSENMLQRIYRRPHEIEPQLEALFIAREGKKATQLLVRELESIIVQCQQELIKAIEDEGYKAK